MSRHVHITSNAYPYICTREIKVTRRKRERGESGPLLQTSKVSKSYKKNRKKRGKRERSTRKRRTFVEIETKETKTDKATKRLKRVRGPVTVTVTGDARKSKATKNQDGTGGAGTEKIKNGKDHPNETRAHTHAHR